MAWGSGLRLARHWSLAIGEPAHRQGTEDADRCPQFVAARRSVDCNVSRRVPLCPTRSSCARTTTVDLAVVGEGSECLIELTKESYLRTCRKTVLAKRNRDCRSQRSRGSPSSSPPPSPPPGAQPFAIIPLALSCAETAISPKVFAVFVPLIARCRADEAYRHRTCGHIHR